MARMSALSASDPSGEFDDVAPVDKQANNEKSARLVLSDVQRVREALLAMFRFKLSGRPVVRA
jgi:hypothetical protein